MTSTEDDADDPIAEQTRAWVTHAVIGLGLCPFAGAIFADGRIRFRVSGATDGSGLLTDLIDELRLLAAADPQQVETTLLIHPGALRDFFAFNDFLETADAALEQLGLAGSIQVASFHPDYCFADSAADDVANATNRSPYPTLHLLREDSVEQAIDSWGDTDSIFRANIKRLRQLGAPGWAALARRWAAPD